tara:strand:- start:563 stop:712 length:150 start_codon:yes stop_codon:yes gene_type:complete
MPTGFGIKELGLQVPLTLLVMLLNTVALHMLQEQHTQGKPQVQVAVIGK